MTTVLIGIGLMLGITVLGWIAGKLLDWHLGSPETVQEALRTVEEIERSQQEHADWERLYKENPEQATAQYLNSIGL